MKEFNLQEIRTLYHLSQEEMAREIGYSRELINKVEKGKMKASKWLVGAVEKWEKAKQKKQAEKLLISPAGNYLDERRRMKQSPAEVKVPLVAVKAQAGYVKSFEQTDYLNALEQYSLPPGVHPAGAIWRYFEIDGDSMEPSLQAGDVVLATMVPMEDWKDIRPLHIYIIHTKEQLLIKRLQKRDQDTFLLISDNEQAYPAQALPLSAIKQLWYLRRHIRSQVPPPASLSCA